MDRFRALTLNQRVGVFIAAAAVLTLIIATSLWSKEPSYKILFSNLSDKDGGSVTAALQQLNIPYRVDDGGVVSVPGDQVYDIRLKLAAQGLPKGGTVGFELMDNQKFGLTEFAEQVNYQRAIEGELARSIESIQAVQAARVHLAIPKASVFVRDLDKPTASVLLTMYSGRVVDSGQVAAIIHLVSSAVPELSPQNVTVVDQSGKLLSNNSDANSGLDSQQLTYVHLVEQNLVKRIEDILNPIVGADNVHAEVTAELDFAQTEHTSEDYGPNSPSKPQAIRSQQTVESTNSENTNPVGVPGALSNQPPGAATAPLTATNNPGGTPANGGNPSSVHRENTINFEIDKTITHTKEPVGSIKRLSAAVVINYRRDIKDGKVVHLPMAAAELKQYNELIKDTMGFHPDRGDSLNVVNAPFATDEGEVADKTLMERLMEIVDRLLDLIKDDVIGFLKYVFFGILTLYVVFGIIRPIIRRLTSAPEAPQPEINEEAEAAAKALAEKEAELKELEQKLHEPTTEEREQALRMASYADNLEAVKQMAKDDPRMVANIVRAWLANESLSEKR